MHHDRRYSARTGFGRRLLSLTPGLMLGCTLLWTPAPGAQPTALLIENARPIDAVSGEQPLTDLLVDAGRIVAMGRDLAAPPGAEVLDAGGRPVIPGLWDMHVHLTYDARFTDVMPDLFLDYGVTSVRDTGGLLDAVLPVVRAMRSGARPAPRVFFAGPLLDGVDVVYDGVHAAHIGSGNPTVDAARDNVARLVDAGVDFLKIYEMVSPEVFRAIVAAARAAGLPIAAHVPLSMLASEAGPAVNSMEHLRNLELDCAGAAPALLETRRALLAAGAVEGGLALRSQLHALQRDRAIAAEDSARCDQVIRALRNTIQVPTARLNAMAQFPPFRQPDWPRALARLPAPVADDWARAPDLISMEEPYRISGAWTLRMLPRLRDMGVPIAAGTDTPIGWAIPGFSLHSELEILVAAGLTPTEALASATRVPATFFGREGEMGRIATNVLADLVVLEASPLEDIRNTRRIHAVIAAGRIVRR